MSVQDLTKIPPTTYKSGTLQAKLYLPSTYCGRALIGYIGDLTEESGGPRSTHEQRVEFLQGAKNSLLAMGVEKVIGPVDGNTWHRYRLPLSGARPLTFLEPDYPGFAPADFISAGMPIIATYRTSLVSDLSLAIAKLAAEDTLDAKTLKREGVRIRTINLDNFEDELERLHRFSLDAFRNNFLYSEIDVDAFRQLYRPVKVLLRKELVIIAETDDAAGTVLGVVLALPDPQERSSVIVKTLARHSTAPRGLGRYLFYEVVARAHQLGYSKAVCALMKDDNFSAFMPEQLDGKVIRKFALFGCNQ